MKTALNKLPSNFFEAMLRKPSIPDSFPFFKEPSSYAKKGPFTQFLDPEPSGCQGEESSVPQFLNGEVPEFFDSFGNFGNPLL